MGVQNDSFIPGVGAYSIKGEFNPEENKKKAISFGVSRDVDLYKFSTWNLEAL